MTDAAFAAADAAPAPSSVPIDAGNPQIPNPAETSNIAPRDETQRGQPETGSQRAERRSLDDIIKASHEKVTKGETSTKEAPKPAPEAKAKPEPAKETPKQEAQPKGPDGKFQPRQQPQDQGQQQAPQQPAQKPTGQHAEAPSRFSPDAKAEWATAPESVRAEVHRMHREFEQGYAKYKGDAEAYNSVRDFDQYAKQNGTNLRAVLANYATLERQLVQGDDATKEAALQKVFQRANINPRQWAAHLLNQPQDQRDAESHETITALRNEIASLKQSVQGITSHVQQQQQTALTDNVTAFAKANPRFDELSDGSLEYSIQRLLDGNNPDGIVIDAARKLPPQQRLQKAYDMADRLNPSSAPRPSSSDAPPAPSNDAGSKSIGGSPANGSDPSTPARKNGQKSSIDDAIRRAAARVAS